MKALLKDILMAAFFLFVAFCMLIGITGCYGTKKATKQSVKAYAVYPELVAGLHAKWFDPKYIIKDSTVYIEGKPYSVPGPTLYVNCDSQKNAAQNDKSLDTKKVPVKCPPCENRVDTTYKYQYVQVVNKAQIQSMQNEIDELKASAVRKSTTLNILWWVVGLLSLYTVARWLIKYFTRFTLP